MNFVIYTQVQVIAACFAQCWCRMALVCAKLVLFSPLPLFPPTFRFFSPSLPLPSLLHSPLLFSSSLSPLSLLSPPSPLSHSPLSPSPLQVCARVDKLRHVLPCQRCVELRHYSLGDVLLRRTALRRPHWSRGDTSHNNHVISNRIRW